MNKSVKKCCICNNNNVGEYLIMDHKKYHLICIKKLYNNWNELKKWLEEQDIFITKLPVFMKEIAIEHKTMSLCYESILDKMQELERGEE